MNNFYHQLTERINQEVIGCESQIKLIHETLNSFLYGNESGSMVLIGARGCGKKTILSKVLKDYKNETRLSIVRVNGFVHSTDRLAVKHIALQMRRDRTAVTHVVTDEDEDEVEFEEEHQVEDIPSASVADYFRRLLARNPRKRSQRSFLFIVEEMDLFAQMGDQILLYSLLDASRSNDLAPIFVLGLTARHDIFEMLEKRVRSRLDNRLVHFDQKLDFQEYKNNAESLLMLLQRKTSVEKAWSRAVTDLFQSDDVIDRLMEIHYRDCGVATLKHLLIGLIALADEDEPYINPEMFLNGAAEQTMPAEDPFALIIEGLSVFELCLLVCVLKRHQLSNGGAFNFQTITDDFFRFSRSYHLNFVRIPKEVLCKSLERFCELSLIGPVSGGLHSKNQQILFRPMLLQVDPDLVERVALNYQPLPTAVAQWITNKKSIYN